MTSPYRSKLHSLRSPIRKKEKRTICLHGKAEQEFRQLAFRHFGHHILSTKQTKVGYSADYWMLTSRKLALRSSILKARISLPMRAHWHAPASLLSGKERFCSPFFHPTKKAIISFKHPINGFLQEMSDTTGVEERQSEPLPTFLFRSETMNCVITITCVL